MGRTLPTSRGLMERLMVEWAPFRRALRQRDREAFDSIMTKAMLHASSSSFLTDADPAVPVILSILLEQEKELRELRDLRRMLAEGRD